MDIPQIIRKGVKQSPKLGLITNITDIIRTKAITEYNSVFVTIANIAIARYTKLRTVLYFFKNSVSIFKIAPYIIPDKTIDQIGYNYGIFIILICNSMSAKISF